MKSLLIIFLGAILILFAGLGKKENKMSIWAFIVLVLALVAAVLDFTGNLKWDFENNMVPREMLNFNQISLGFTIIIITASILVVGLFRQKETTGADLLGLIMFSICGAILMTAWNNLILLFLGLEAMSIPLYVLAGSKKLNLKSNEAAIKYFLMGAFSSAIFLLGCGFLYGATGGLDVRSLYFASEKMVHMQAVSELMTVGSMLVLVGLSFKISAVPFHFWSPDVYEGSPNRATIFMATIVKIAAFSSLFKLYSLVFADQRHENWGLILSILSAATILIGNIGALVQSGVKRTMAYSSIAHAGYMLLAIISIPEATGLFSFPLKGLQALMIYGIAYVFANSVIFYYINQLTKLGNEGFSSFNGLAKRNPVAALLIALSMFSLAGIPITAGFAGKYALFTSAFLDYPWLVIIALAGSAISIAYYFRIFKSVYFTEGEADVNSSIGEKLLLGIAGLGIILVGFAPYLITKLDFLQF